MWIDIREKTPKENQRVITFSGYTGINIMTYYDLEAFENRILQSPNRRCKNLFRGPDGWLTDDVTHWMPLPDPPKTSPESNHRIQVISGMSGYFAVLLADITTEKGEYTEIIETGIGRYENITDAQDEAKVWAEEMNLPYISSHGWLRGDRIIKAPSLHISKLI